MIKKTNFTPNEVMAMFKTLRNDISVIAEGQTGLREDVETMKVDIKELKTDMTTVKEALRVSIPDIYRRVSRLESKVS